MIAQKKLSFLNKQSLIETRRELKAGGIAPAGFEALAADRSGWRSTTLSAIKTAEQKREEQWEDKRARRRQRAEANPSPRTTTSSHAATAAGSAARGSVSTATAGAAAPPQTDHGRNSIVSRDRRTPLMNRDPKGTEV